MINNIDELINLIYNKTINIVIEGFEEDLQQSVCKEYMKFLNEKYHRLENQINYNKALDDLCEIEELEWSEMPIGVKKNLLFKDKDLDDIKKLSSIAYKYAKGRLLNNTTIETEQANNMISELNKLRKQVADYNISLADWYISESTMDLKYSSCQTDNMSLRIGRLK